MPLSLPSAPFFSCRLLNLSCRLLNLPCRLLNLSSRLLTPCCCCRPAGGRGCCPTVAAVSGCCHPAAVGVALPWLVSPCRRLSGSVCSTVRWWLAPCRGCCRPAGGGCRPAGGRGGCCPAAAAVALPYRGCRRLSDAVGGCPTLSAAAVTLSWQTWLSAGTQQLNSQLQLVR